MRRSFCLIFALLLSGGAEAVEGTVRDGNMLFDVCQNGKPVPALEAFKMGMCVGFVTGVSDTLYGTTVCGPENVSVQQMVDVVKLYLTNHPERRHLAARDLAANALTEAFPCSNQSR
jgi:hypothetical protein